MVTFCRINLVWEDKRYIASNKHRISECGSKHVLWTKPNQFWLPKLRIWGALELVSDLMINLSLNLIVFTTTATYTSKGGFFEEPEKEGTAGNRDLMYDVINGTFTLFTKSYAKIECNMGFGEYPFDTQMCSFIMQVFKNASYQVNEN